MSCGSRVPQTPTFPAESTGSAPPSGAAGGVLAGTYPNPTFNGSSVVWPVLGSSMEGATVTLSATEFASVSGSATFGAAEVTRQFILPIGGRLTRLYAAISNAQPASGSLVVTVRKNGADTALTVTFAASATAGTQSDTSSLVTVAAGDLISVKFVNGATAASAAVIGFSFQLIPA